MVSDSKSVNDNGKKNTKVTPPCKNPGCCNPIRIPVSQVNSISGQRLLPKIYVAILLPKRVENLPEVPHVGRPLILNPIKMLVASNTPRSSLSIPIEAAFDENTSSFKDKGCWLVVSYVRQISLVRKALLSTRRTWWPVWPYLLRDSLGCRLLWYPIWFSYKIPVRFVIAHMMSPKLL